MKSRYPHPHPDENRTLQVRSTADYAGVASSYLAIARAYSSPLWAGPPLCDELVALVQHMFDADEAGVMQHLRLFSRGKTARAIAAAEKRPGLEVAAILERLTEEKHILVSRGQPGKRRYFMLPLFPGTMENILFCTDRTGLTPWHQGFARLFDALYATGYLLDYGRHPAAMVRYLPVNRSIVPPARAWPSDRLEQILERFDHFAVTACQCRLTMELKGSSCGKPLETCVMMGGLAERMVHTGRMRRVERQEVLDLKQLAEASGLVTWVGNVDALAGSNISCSCCGCCCYMLRLITQFSAPAMIARPHFVPVHDQSRCRMCGTCALVCQTRAITVDQTRTLRTWSPACCIGCGLCVSACSNQALQLESIGDIRRPPAGALSYLSTILPPVAHNTMHALRARQKGQQQPWVASEATVQEKTDPDPKSGDRD